MRKGLVARSEDWPWSSCNNLALEKKTLANCPSEAPKPTTHKACRGYQLCSGTVREVEPLARQTHGYDPKLAENPWALRKAEIILDIGQGFWHNSSCDLFATRMVLAKHLKQRRRVTTELRAHGLRMTRQRKVIARVLQKAGKHLGAPEVLRRARLEMPGLHLATVYRALESLKKLGIIDELDLMHVRGSGHYYEARTDKDHMHFTCQRCGSVLEIQTPLFERLKGQIEGRHGLAIRVARLELGGYCGACASKEAKAEIILA